MKLISVHLSSLERTLRLMGTPEMKATSFCDLVARTPTCQSFRHPGDFKALFMVSNLGNASTCETFVPIQE